MLAATNYGLWLPPMWSEHGAGVDQIIDWLHYFMAALFVAWGIFFVYCLMRFRQRPGHKANYHPVKAKISKYGEIGVVVFEVFVLFGLSVPVWAKYKNDPPAKADRTEIRVVGQQYQWNFHYPGKDGVFGRADIALMTGSNPLGLIEDDPAGQDDAWTINELHLPVGQDVYMRVSSKDVIHSFNIPCLRVKQDAVPGMSIPIWFKVLEGKTSDVLLKQLQIRVPIEKANYYKLRQHVAAEDHVAKDNDKKVVVLAKGDGIGFSKDKAEALFERLRAAGVTELVLRPRSAMEVVCAQLCGNEHYKMKAPITTHTPADYEAWVAKNAVGVEPDPDAFDF